MDTFKLCMDHFLRILAVVGGRTWEEARSHEPRATEASIARGSTLALAVGSTWLAVKLSGADWIHAESAGWLATAGAALFVLLDRRFYRVGETGSIFVRGTATLVRALCVVPIVVAAFQSAPRLYEAELVEYALDAHGACQESGRMDRAPESASGGGCKAADEAARHLVSRFASVRADPDARVVALPHNWQPTWRDLQSAIAAGRIGWWMPWLLPSALGFLFMVPLLLGSLAPIDEAGHRRREDAVATERLARSRTDAWRRGTT